jgi:endonuclease/exonuclease/phosphatase family metal-dependent hydrolase
MKLRVATYNIHKGVTGMRGKPRIHDVRLALHNIDADVVFLQEVQDRNDRLVRHVNQPSGTQLEFLTAQIYDHHCYGKNAVYPHGHHGNAILSRLPIRQFANHDISDHALEKRGLLHAIARGGRKRGEEVHLICVHFGLFKRSRIRQASFLADFVRDRIPKRAPVIIAGDFNDWHKRVDDVLREKLDVCEVTDKPNGNGDARTLLDRVLPWRRDNGPSQLARTFPSFAPWLTLDRIYVRGLHVHGVRVPRGVEWARRSDHAPLIAELEFE